MKLSFKQGVALVIISSVMWGVSGVFGQFLFENYHTNASWLITVRQLIAGALFLGYLIVTRYDIFAIFKNRADTLELLLFSFGGLLGAQYGFYVTISLANAATATILQYSAPIFVVMWMVYKERRRPEGRELLGIVLAFTGVFLISTHGRPDQLVMSPLALTLGLISAVSLAIYTVCPSTILKKYNTTVVMGWGQLLSGTLLSCLFNPLNCGSGWDVPSVLAMAYIIIGGTIIPFTMFLIGLTVIGPTKATLISCAEPLSSILCVVIFLGTRLEGIDIVGMLCIITTVMLLSVQRK